jgi:hypothetical protein
VRTTAISGDVVVRAEPLDFSASREQVEQSTIQDIFVSPRTLSAFPLMPRAIGLFLKGDEGYNIPDSPKNPDQPFGNEDGEFVLQGGNKKILSVTSDPDGTDTPGYFRAILAGGTVSDTNYNAVIIINLETANPELASFASVVSQTKTVSSFDFLVYDVFASDPFDVYEISIQVY